MVAYAVTQHPPLPYRLKASSLRFEVPGIDISGLFPDTKFFKAMRESDTWRFITKLLFTLRTWSRRTIWGDRVSSFLFFTKTNPSPFMVLTHSFFLPAIPPLPRPNDHPSTIAALSPQGRSDNARRQRNSRFAPRRCPRRCNIIDE